MNRAEQRILNKVGANLRAERARLGMTQEAVAQRAGMHTTQVARMERAETDTGVAKFVRVAQALRIDPGVLFQGIEHY